MSSPVTIRGERPLTRYSQLDIAQAVLRIAPGIRVVLTGDTVDVECPCHQEAM